MDGLIILKGGRVIDPVNGRDEVADLWVTDGKIVASQAETPADAKVIDATGCWVVPGLIDIHVHLREPGQEYKENVASGTQAAAAGGFTAVACMPNTTPVNDNGSVTRLILERAEGCAARVYPVGAISKGSKGESLADYAEMKEAGIVAVTDDGMPVVDSQLMRRAMEYAASHKLVVMSHSEEEALVRNGCMNEGLNSTRLGLRGIPAAAESIMVYREVALAELTGTHVHIAHVSCEDALAVIRLAKQRGVKVTAETAPHYFTLTDDAVLGYNTNAKMNPPLRSEKDREAIRAALADGTLDAIATDHAPHSVLEKELEFNYAANGITGLETSLSLTLELVRQGVITESRMVELMSAGPAGIIGVEGGQLGEGAVADITVIDPEMEYVFTAEASFSKGKNSPFNETKMKGRAIMTLVDGEVKYRL
ncbi:MULTISPECIES: dihydroorotase [Desulfosediminicola]|uniref:dihydroorotase n=1 Tax=Desulfosediminicola TaxID=2886823 RepID=UPI0010AD44BF|nr:dihydroorotase [Desulfosediminicola ganghwensis]